MSSLVAIFVASTVFLFKYPTGMNFATWATVATASGSIYHTLCIRDDKRPDAC
jgi:hypothetical protein